MPPKARVFVVFLLPTARVTLHHLTEHGWIRAAGGQVVYEEMGDMFFVLVWGARLPRRLWVCRLRRGGEWRRQKPNGK
jgi:hypothetical protein